MAGENRIRSTNEIGEALLEEGPQEQVEVAEKKENTMRHLKIIQQDYGYCVEVGCNTMAIESKETLIKALTEYINDPSSTEKKFTEGKLFVHQILK